MPFTNHPINVLRYMHNITYYTIAHITFLFALEFRSNENVHLRQRSVFIRINIWVIGFVISSHGFGGNYSHSIV